MSFSYVQLCRYFTYTYDIIDVRNCYTFDQQGIDFDNWA